MRGRTVAEVTTRLSGLVRRGRGRGIVVVVRLALLVLFQLGNELFHVFAGGFQLHGEQEQLALVDVLALLPKAPFQELLEDVLHALQTALVRDRSLRQ